VDHIDVEDRINLGDGSILITHVEIEWRLDVFPLFHRQPCRDRSKTIGITLGWLPDAMRQSKRSRDNHRVRHLLSMIIDIGHLCIVVPAGKDVGRGTESD
jgi:hypothetical protein